MSTSHLAPASNRTPRITNLLTGFLLLAAGSASSAHASGRCVQQGPDPRWSQDDTSFGVPDQPSGGGGKCSQLVRFCVNGVPDQPGWPQVLITLEIPRSEQFKVIRSQKSHLRALPWWTAPQAGTLAIK